jgi:hypothetical protein
MSDTPLQMPGPMTVDEITAAVVREILGSPIDPIPVELRAFHDAFSKQADVCPLSCDLTGDRTACAILRQWARQPWEPIHRMVLLDRMEELGKSEEEMEWLRNFHAEMLKQEINKDKYTRTALNRKLRVFRRELIRQFGDFESQTDTP